MKITELMIGDWVKCEDSKCEGHQVDLIDLGNEEVGLDGEIENLENIISIPLTSEILEKNGYRNSLLVDDYYIAHGIHYNVDLKCIMFGYEYGSVLEVKCEYVHELQHTLKLCKIEKKIVL